jgi:SNF2 family DNA or RNA helicase
MIQLLTFYRLLISVCVEPCFRVVITTYDRVRSEFKRCEANPAAITNSFEESPLFDIEWYRVILDESHKVRGGTMLFHSVNALKSKYRWCLSGTPFQVTILIVCI